MSSEEEASAGTRPAGCELTWLFVADVDVEADDDDVSEEGSPPVDDEHHHSTEDGSSQGHPHVVELKAGTPACSSSNKQPSRLAW